MIEYKFVPVQFGGLDTKTDDKNMIVGNFTILQNMWMNKTGKLEKAYGYSAIVTSLTGKQCYVVADFKSKPIVFGNGNVQQINNNAATTMTAASWPVEIVLSKLIYSPGSVGDYFGSTPRGYSISEGDSFYVISYTQRTSASIYLLTYMTIDKVTQFVLYSNTDEITVGTSASGNFGTAGFNHPTRPGFFYCDSNRVLKLRRFTSATTSTVIDVDSTIALSGYKEGYRAYQANDIVYVIYWNDGLTEVKIASIPINSNTPYTRVLATGVVGRIPVDVSAAADGSVVSAVWAAVNGANLDIYWARLTSGAASVTATANVGSTGLAAHDIGDLVCYTQSDTDRRVLWTVYANVAENEAVQRLILWYPSSGFSTVELSYGMSIVSRLFKINEKGLEYLCFYAAGWYCESCFSLCVIDTIDNTFAGSYIRAMNGFHFGRAPRCSWSRENYYLSQISDTSLTFIFNEIISAQFAANNLNRNIGLRLLKLSGTATATSTSEWSNDVATITNGSLGFFDGQRMLPNCFYHAPAAARCADKGSGSSHTNGAVYKYCLIFEDHDQTGNLLRSTPSDITTYTAGNTNDVNVTFNGSALVDLGIVPYTSPYFLGAFSSISVYKTGPNGTIFYLVHTERVNKIGTVTWVDNRTDAETIAGTPLYTTGGLLEAVPSHHCRDITVGKNRLWFLSADYDEIWFSNAFLTGEFPLFNEALKIPIGSKGGDPIGIMEMDDKIIVMRREAMQVLFGDGPDATGAGAFSGPQIINAEFGALSAKSMVLTDDGIMFQSDRGIWLLTRSLQAVYLGAPVDDWNANTVTAAFNMQDRDQTWFQTSNGNTLIYDSFHKRWYTKTNEITKHACLVNRVPTWLNIAADFSQLVFQESKSAYSANGSAIEMKFVTGWMSFAGLQGFQRVRRLQFVGQLLAANTATLKIYYDMDPDVFETISIASATIKPIGDDLYQYEVRLKRQKCESIKIELSVTDSTQAFSLAGMAFEVGVKQGLNRMALYKRVTSS